MSLPISVAVPASKHRTWSAGRDQTTRLPGQPHRLGLRLAANPMTVEVFAAWRHPRLAILSRALSMGAETAPATCAPRPEPGAFRLLLMNVGLNQSDQPLQEPSSIRAVGW